MLPRTPGIIVNPKWVWFAMDRDKFKAINDRMRKEFHQTLKVGESTAMLHNDGRQTRKYRWSTASLLCSWGISS